MAGPPALRLHEELLLLALRDKKGTFESGTMYAFALGGALLAELLLERRIEVEPASKRKLARLVSDRPTGDPILDECLGRVRDAKRRAALQTWVSRFASTKGLKHRVAAELCRRGILRADEDKLLMIFRRRIYPELDPGPERELRERLRRAILTEVRDVDPRTLVLVSIANATGLLKVVFDRKTLKSRKPRIERLATGELTGRATKEAIEAMQAAVAIAAIMPAITAATSAHR